MNIYPSSAEAKLRFDLVRARLMAHVRSRLGQDRVERMRTTRNVDWLRAELARVAELQEAFRFDDAVPFEYVLDVRGVLRQAKPEEAYVSPEDLLAVRRVLITLRRLQQYFRQRQAKYPYLAEMTGRITPLPDVERHIEGIVDEEGLLRDDASPELRRIRRLILQRQGELRATLQRALRAAMQQGYATEEQPTIRNGRMVIPIRAEAKRKVQGFVQDTSGSGQTVYIEPAACLDLNNEVRELESEERREIERILRAATAHLRRHLDVLQDDLRLLALLDLIQAKALLSNELDAVVPEVREDGLIEIREGRNPALLLHFRRQHAQQGGEARAVVPLDLTLGEDYRTLVITGPNAGGKTVAMKTVGLFALMLAYGLPLPVDPKTRFGLFRQLFVDIGDEQSIEEDLSTFSSHVTNLKHMLARADEGTLILIDEAGTGTDPDEGGALAQAVLERLNARGARTIATTHHGTLKVFAHETEGIENGSMEFDQATLSPTYRFRERVPGSSYAFEIASRIGLGQDMLARARALVGEQKAALEDLIATFEARNQRLAADLAEAEQTLAEARKERQEYEDRLRRLRKERDAIRQQALEEAERIVQGANARVERTIREIKEAQAEREATREARARLEAFRENVQEGREALDAHDAAPAKTTLPRKRPARAAPNGQPANGKARPIRVGDQVRLDDGAMTGEVQELDGDEAVITAGAMRLRVDVERLTKVGGPRKQQVTVRSGSDAGTAGIAALHARTQVDLRGYRVEEALPEVARLLDDALAANLDRVEILHGKGTGVLRQAVHAYLAEAPEVTGFEDAPWDQGGPGVTVVHL